MPSSNKKEQQDNSFLLNSRLQTVNKIYKSILAAQSLEEIANAALEDLLNLIPSHLRSSFMVFDLEKNKAKMLSVFAKTNISIDAGEEFPADKLSSFSTLSSGKVWLVGDIRKLSYPSDSDKELMNAGILSYFMFPLIDQGKLVGSLNLASTQVDVYTEEVVRILTEVGNALTLSIRQFNFRETIEKNNKELKKKNKDILDSIMYAKRIQQAILPSNDLIFQTLRDSFIIYKPKDIVSGDFYFFTEKKEKVIIGAVDCTGHGVPGAFMSLIGNELLNQIVMEKGIIEPAAILNELNENLKTALRQYEQDTESRDGMDVALCMIDLFGQKLEFAGAYRPLYLVRKSAMPETVKLENFETLTQEPANQKLPTSNFLLEEIKGNRFPVAGFHLTKERIFENHCVNFQKGDTIYLFSDGYADQFGGLDGKTKFTTRRFRELLLSIQHLPMSEQGKILENKFHEWKGSTPQVDDVVIIGVRF